MDRTGLEFHFLFAKNKNRSHYHLDNIHVSGRGPNLPDTTGHMFRVRVVNRFSFFLRVDAASKLPNHVDVSFTDREGLTKCHLMVSPCEKKKIDSISLQPLAMYSWLMTVATKGGRTVLFACPGRLIDKRHAPTWLQHTNRFCVALRIICGLSTTFIHDYGQQLRTRGLCMQTVLSK